MKNVRTLLYTAVQRWLPILQSVIILVMIFILFVQMTRWMKRVVSAIYIVVDQFMYL